MTAEVMRTCQTPGMAVTTRKIPDGLSLYHLYIRTSVPSAVTSVPLFSQDDHLVKNSEDRRGPTSN